MSKKNCAYRVVALITVLMLSFAPMTFAADGSNPVSVIDTLIESIADALDDLFGGNDENTENTESEDDEGLPDFGPLVDPNG